jgi:protein TonB
MILTLILAMGKYMSLSVQPMVIDFSISSAKPKTASTIQKKETTVKRISRSEPIKKPVEQKVVQPVIPKPVKPVPEQIKVVKKEISEPLPKEVVAVKHEEQAPAPPEPVQAEAITDTAPDNVQTQVAQVSDDPEPAGIFSGEDPDTGPSDPRARYIKAHYEYIKNDIQKKIIYPLVARKKGWQGMVVVSFVVCKDGKVQDVKIKESSGFSILDQSAVNTIKKAAPFPPPPSRAELIVPISYSLV